MTRKRVFTNKGHATDERDALDTTKHSFNSIDLNKHIHQYSIVDMTGELSTSDRFDVEPRKDITGEEVLAELEVLKLNDAAPTPTTASTGFDGSQLLKKCGSFRKISDFQESALLTEAESTSSSSSPSASIDFKPSKLLSKEDQAPPTLLHCCDSSREKTQTAAGEPKSVSFSTIRFREYPIRIGDSPAVTRGVPLTIDWDHTCEYELGLEDFEDVRPTRRLPLQLKMGALDRVKLVKRMGYGHLDIKEGIKAANVGRSRRQRTKELLHFAQVQEMLERIKRASLNATVRRYQKRKERSWIDKHRIHMLDESVYTQQTDGSLHHSR